MKCGLKKMRWNMNNEVDNVTTEIWKILLMQITCMQKEFVKSLK